MGGPSREFWRFLVHAIKQKYCRGDVEEGRMVFEQNTPALQVNKLSVCILYFLIAIKILIKRSYINAATICDMPNIPFTQHSELRMLGNLVAMSSLQGGPGFPVLPVIYEYISTGKYNVQNITNADVPDCQVQHYWQR